MTTEPTPVETAHPGSPGAARPTFDPFVEGFAADPYPHYRTMCEQNPVQQGPLGPWFVFGYDDCARLLRDPTLSVQEESLRGANPQAELRIRAFGDQARGQRGMLNLDPPDHTRIRQIVQKVFTPKAIEQLTGRVQALADAALDDAVAQEVDSGGPVDLIDALAFPLPFQVISEMLGMPDGNREQLRNWSHTTAMFLEPTLAPFHLDEIAAASEKMLDHLLAAIEWKRTHPATLAVDEPVWNGRMILRGLEALPVSLVG